MPMVRTFRTDRSHGLARRPRVRDTRGLLQRMTTRLAGDDGAATAEYAVATMAIVGEKRQTRCRSSFSPVSHK